MDNLADNPRFSQRIGKKPIKIQIQFESMDNDLRTSLWNVFQIYFLDQVGSNHIEESSFSLFFKVLWSTFFKYPLDTLDNYFQNTYTFIRDNFFNKFKWFDVYDFLEFVANCDSPVNKVNFKIMCNIMLERELSGYRFVGDFIEPITDKNEIKEVEEALEISSSKKLIGVREHLNSALAKFSDRKSPDYRNSIKESISAVESICKIISGEQKAELGQALKKIENKVELHPALKKGFSSIYGYACDEGGIRHAMLEGNRCDFEDAKYMIVSCSAFINYLIIKAEKAGIII